MKEIVFVTGNKGKQAEAQKWLDRNNIVVSCYDYDIYEPDVNDIEFIAKTKVLQAYEKVNKPCIALDAGFYINNYPNNPGFPGAFPKRELLNKIGIDGLLGIMKDVEDRSCYFKECLAYYDGKDISYFYGVSKGEVVKEKVIGDNTKKWSELWYIFRPDNCNKTLSEMTEEERENRPDNHTNALKEFSEWFYKK